MLTAAIRKVDRARSLFAFTVYFAKNQFVVIPEGPLPVALIRSVVLALAIILLPCPVFAQLAATTFKTGRPPSWVMPAASEPLESTEASQGAGGQVFALFDTQANAAKGEAYLHVVKQITDPSGVQNGSNLEFSWDPSYQELTIHAITIERGTNRLNRLEPAKFKVIQQETDLNRHIYNGTLAAVLFLDDVRVGDRIEYSYTLRGENPSLKGRYSEVFSLGWAVPVGHRQIRLLWPKDRPIHVRVHGSRAEPAVHEQEGAKEYVWDLHQLPAVSTEDQIPSWLIAYPWIQVSEFASWAEVATWVAEHFVTTNLAAPEVQEAIANLRRPGEPAEKTVQRALEFAQNEIRYLGIEFGPHSYHPTDPVTVLQRRFGDCKDKAFVLCTLLQGLGYEATPALVATGLRQTLPDFIPAPHVFDHVIVRVVADGFTYWLDPTRSHQHGSIRQRYLPDYGFALLVQAGEKGLTAIPTFGQLPAETQTSEVFRIGDQQSPGHLEVITTYKGFDAEWMRNVLAELGRERVQKSLLSDYAQLYPDITPAAAMIVEDDPNQDQVSISHHYTITNIWTLSADKEKYSCSFFPYGIQAWTAKPNTTVRSMPMELSFPRRRLVQTHVILPSIFQLTGITNTITGPATELKQVRRYDELNLWMSYEYNALTNFVPTALASEHIKSLAQIGSSLGYTLNWQNLSNLKGKSQFNWPIFILTAIYTVALLLGLFFLHRRQTQNHQPANVPPLLEDAHLNGLNGWLILVGIGLVISPFRTWNSMIASLDSFSLWRWHALTQTGAATYHPGWKPLLILELLGTITILVVNLAVIMLFFKKRRLFPRWCIAYWSFLALFGIVDSICVHCLNPTPAVSREIARSFMQLIIFGCIWIPYMCLSRRVKATFMR